MPSVAVKIDEREVALGEVQAVLAAARDESYRARLASLADAVERGSLAAADTEELERVLELGLQAGRIRAVYGPGGEQAALTGRSLDSLRIEAVGPGMYRIALVAGGAEVAVRLDRSGAQLASIGV